MSISTKESECLEEKYLRLPHEQLSTFGLIDLHTYLLEKGFHSCPICNEWLVVRVIPKEFTQ